MRAVIISLMTMCYLVSYSQDFATKLYFQDSKGNKDTLTFGYSNNATNSIDTSFGEKDINGLEFNSVFEVRISDEYRMSFFELPFLTKKQIFKSNCSVNNYPVVASILVKSKNYPIKVQWDKAAFSDSCRNYSLITNWNPGGWFDAGSGDRFFLKDTNVAVFASGDQWYDYNYTINNGFVDTLSLLYFTIASEKSYWLIAAINIAKGDEMQIYPNPVKDKLVIKTSLSTPIEVAIYDLYGKRFYCKNNGNEFDFTSVPQGLYIISINVKGQSKVIKQKILKL